MANQPRDAVVAKKFKNRKYTVLMSENNTRKYSEEGHKQEF
jgi:hypothetical protein